MPAFNWLHLTDLHLGTHPGTNTQAHLWPNVRDAFFADLTELHQQCGPWDVVLFTGDLVQRGDEAEFEQLDHLFDQLWSHLNKLGSTPVLLAVPGNHDLTRPKKTSAVRTLNRWHDEPEIQPEFWQDPESEYREVITQAFANYQRWWRNTPLRQSLTIEEGLLPGDFSVSWHKDGLSIGLVGLNTTFLQLTSDDYFQKLVWDVRQLHQVCDGDAANWTQQHHACLLMTHQPPNWLSDKVGGSVYAEVNPAGRFATHLFGHMHQNETRRFSIGGGKEVHQWQGHSLFGVEQFDGQTIERAHGYAAGCIEINTSTGEGNLRHWPRKAVYDETNGWRFIPDHDSGVLGSDNGTKAQAITLLKPWSADNKGLAKPPTKPTLQQSQSDERYKQHFLKQYQAAMLRECDIIHLNGLPEGDQEMAMQKILLRQLYVPLRMTIEVNKEELLEKLELQREQQRLHNAGRGVGKNLKQKWANCPPGVMSYTGKPLMCCSIGVPK